MTDFSLKKFWTGKIACCGYLSFNGTFVHSLPPALYGYGAFCKVLIINRLQIEVWPPIAWSYRPVCSNRPPARGKPLSNHLPATLNLLPDRITHLSSGWGEIISYVISFVIYKRHKPYSESTLRGRLLWRNLVAQKPAIPPRDLFKAYCPLLWIAGGSKLISQEAILRMRH